MNKLVRKHYWLYVLKLELGKYYVGVTTKTPEARLKDHINGFGGAAWTRLHKPLGIFDRKDLGVITYEEAEKYENKVIRVQADKLGIENVRGGDLSQTDEMVKKIGRYYVKDDWVALYSVVIMLFILLIIFVLEFKK